MSDCGMVWPGSSWQQQASSRTVTLNLGRFTIVFAGIQSLMAVPCAQAGHSQAIDEQGMHDNMASSSRAVIMNVMGPSVCGACMSETTS